AINLSENNANAERSVQKRQKRVVKAEKKKEKQQQRRLPPEYAEQLLKQSEDLTKKNLERELKRFQEMAVKMRQQKEGLLNQVEKRKLSPSAPADANNTSEARKIPEAGNPPLTPNPSVDNLYDMLKQYETEIQNNHLASSA